ncbi:MAG: ankyrin repeat domain-containing protein, partial [Flavobacterium psychrophilum]
MTNYLEKIIIDIELQSIEGIKECFENGISPDAEFKNRPLIYEVISGYPRGEGFKKSIKAFVDYGVTFEDKVLLAVLLDDP